MNAASLTERLIQTAVDYEAGRCGKREMAEARAAVEDAIQPKAVLHPQTAALVDSFASALKEKLLKAQIKYGYSDNWRTDDWEAKCRQKLMQHIAKGDPLDVAAYAAFLWARGWLTALQAEC
jgi:hypothetical protein